jgi:hypothetical protein
MKTYSGSLHLAKGVHVMTRLLKNKQVKSDQKHILVTQNIK